MLREEGGSVWFVERFLMEKKIEAGGCDPKKKAEGREGEKAEGREGVPGL